MNYITKWYSENIIKIWKELHIGWYFGEIIINILLEKKWNIYYHLMNIRNSNVIVLDEIEILVCKEKEQKKISRILHENKILSERDLKCKKRCF